MKNKLIKNTIMTVAVSTAIAVLAFAQNIKPVLAKDINFVPINYAFNHWAETYLDKLSANYDVEEIYKDKNLNDYIFTEDFKNIVKLTIDKDYENLPESVSREAMVHELTKIWAEKTGKELDKIPIIKMLIYSDTENIDKEYLTGIYIAYMYDIAKGRGGRIFDPKTNVTYGELAVLINNTINAVEKELTSNSIVKGKYETKGNYEIKDGRVIFNFELMSHYAAEQELLFSSGQQFELTITDEKDEEVYRFSDGKFFTMALLYKTLNPGESLKWQDEWNMTNKDGEKLSCGNYKAVIKVLAKPAEDETIPEEQLTTVIEFDLNEEVVIKPDIAKDIIKESADELIKAIKEKDAKTIAEYVHPIKGVRFTPYTTVSAENDIIMNIENMIRFFEDENLYVWGYYDGSGEEIILTPNQYYEKFIYSEDFIDAVEIGYNEVLTGGNMIENQFDVYKNSIIVEYHIPEINPEYEGLDWQSLRLVFEEYEGDWKLVGVIHNQWTI